MIPATHIDGAKISSSLWRVPASVSLAQDGLESAFGLYTPPNSNNLFGIQALPGLPSVASESHEYIDGRMVPVVEYFAVFSSIGDAFYYHGKLLATNPVYTPAMAVANNPDAFALALTGVYATAPNYGQDLINLMKDDNLYQYDSRISPNPKPIPLPTPIPIPSPSPRPPLAPLTSISGIKVLQYALDLLGATPTLVIDGKFGTNTQRAVRAFQIKAGITVDGIPGPVTEAAILTALN